MSARLRSMLSLGLLMAALFALGAMTVLQPAIKPAKNGHPPRQSDLLRIRVRLNRIGGLLSTVKEDSHIDVVTWCVIDRRLIGTRLLVNVRVVGVREDVYVLELTRMQAVALASAQERECELILIMPRGDGSGYEPEKTIRGE